MPLTTYNPFVVTESYEFNKKALKVLSIVYIVCCLVMQPRRTNSIWRFPHVYLSVSSDGLLNGIVFLSTGYRDRFDRGRMVGKGIGAYIE
jgi:hypothetical protein